MARHPWAVADSPLVFAHRGGSRLAPENTLAAFDRGEREGVDGLELDVRLARDGEVVVCHDARIDRTTDGQGAIAALSSAELARVDAGYRFVDTAGAFPFRGQGIGIPTLREVLARYPRHRLIVEMKDDDRRLAEATVAVVREARAEERVCLGSFHLGILRHARALSPRLATSAAPPEVRVALYGSWFRWFPHRPAYAAMQVPERRERTQIVSRRFVGAAHRAGVAVQVWVVDKKNDILRLLDWSVDGIITDRPDIAVPTVRDWIQEIVPTERSDG